MKYFVTEKTEIGPLKHGPFTAGKALSFVENIDLPDSKHRIEDENGEVIDKIDLRIRAEHAGSNRLFPDELQIRGNRNRSAPQAKAG